MLSRAAELHGEMKKEYAASLSSQQITDRALNLTHEVLEKCANTLDQLMTLAWSVRIKPSLPKPPSRGGYFPAARDEQSFKSTMGQWQAADIDARDPGFAKVLRSIQPMAGAENRWLADLREIVGKKHTHLVPQVRTERKWVKAESAAGSVSYDPGAVTFAPGAVKIFGVPVSARSQLPVPSESLSVTVETWVGFNIEGTGYNALGFCAECIKRTESIIDVFERELGLK